VVAEIVLRGKGGVVGTWGRISEMRNLFSKEWRKEILSVLLKVPWIEKNKLIIWEDITDLAHRKFCVSALLLSHHLCSVRLGKIPITLDEQK
jgi:hypothetical protein